MGIADNVLLDADIREPLILYLEQYYDPILHEIFDDNWKVKCGEKLAERELK